MGYAKFKNLTYVCKNVIKNKKAIGTLGEIFAGNIKDTGPLS